MSQFAGSDEFMKSYRNMVDNFGPDESSIYDTSMSDNAKAGNTVSYDNKEDSQNFMKTYINTNNKFQNKMKDSYEQTGHFDYSSDVKEATPFNPVVMQNQIENSVENFKADSTDTFGRLYGDYFNFQPIPYTRPKTPDPIESEAGDIAEDYLDQIKKYN